MRTILKIVIVLCIAGIIWGFWNTLIKSGTQQASAVSDLVSMSVVSSSTAPSDTTPVAKPESQNAQALSPKTGKTKYLYKPEVKEEDIDEVFIDGSAQHNYVDITGPATSEATTQANKPEDKRKYFLREDQQKQLVAFDNEYRKRKMSKDELFTELMDAVYFDDIPKAMALINKGAPVDSPEKNTAYTPIFMAISNGSGNMLRMLIDQGASIDIYDDKGLTPIHRAITEVNYTGSAIYPAQEIIEILLENGADINQGTRKGGLTPLMVTAQEHKTNIMQFLLESGANDEIKDSNAKTVLDYSKQYQCTSCLRLLLI